MLERNSIARSMVGRLSGECSQHRLLNFHRAFLEVHMLSGFEGILLFMMAEMTIASYFSSLYGKSSVKIS